MGRKFLDIAGESNIGRKRAHNEDNFLICRGKDPEIALAIVADGIGGHSHGEVASLICCRDMFHAALNTPCETWDEKFLLEELEKINRKIFVRNFNDRRTHPMGTTAVAAVFNKEHILAINIGDSRMYEYLPGREEPLRQLTTDHKPSPEVLNKIRILYPELPENKIKGIVMRSLGSSNHIKADIFRFKRHPQASYMLCSDGMYNRTSHQKMEAVFSRCSDAGELTGALMRQALLDGSSDNITIICCGPECRCTEEC